MPLGANSQSLGLRTNITCFKEEHYTGILLKKTRWLFKLILYKNWAALNMNPNTVSTLSQEV